MIIQKNKMNGASCVQNIIRMQETSTNTHKIKEYTCKMRQRQHTSVVHSGV